LHARQKPQRRQIRRLRFDVTQMGMERDCSGQITDFWQLLSGRVCEVACTSREKNRGGKHYMRNSTSSSATPSTESNLGLAKSVSLEVEIDDDEDTEKKFGGVG